MSGEKLTADLAGQSPANGQDITARGRMRILRAARQVLLERGPAGMTVKEVSALAGISRSAFYRRFATKEECVQAVLGEMAEEWLTAMFGASVGQTRMPDGVRARLVDLVALTTAYLDTPGTVGEKDAAGTPGRGSGKERSGWLAYGAAAQLPRAVCQERSRTLRACLSYLGANPGASNTQVRIGVGAKYDSQVCKALERLRGLGLVDKRAWLPGTPNAWTLSAQGEKACAYLAEWPEN